MTNYTIANYAEMFADEVRFASYKKVLNNAVNENTVVLDLGAGSGCLTLLACSLGAKKVYAVEPNPALSIARALVKDNSFEDRVVFFQDKLENIDLPEKVDLIVADLRGQLPLYETNLKLIKFAKDKFLKTSGKLIPLRDKIYLALAGNKAIYLEKIKPWYKHDFNFNLEQHSQRLANFYYAAKILSGDLASQPQLWAEIDYQNITDLSFRNSLQLKTTKDLIYGFYAWFESELSRDTWLLCGPDRNNKVYGSVYFPFATPYSCKIDDEIEISLSAHFLNDSYVWRWQAFSFEAAKRQKFADCSTILASNFFNKVT